MYMIYDDIWDGNILSDIFPIPYGKGIIHHKISWFSMNIMGWEYLKWCLCQRTRYRRTNPHPVAWGGVGWDNNVIGISTWSWCYALWSSLAFPHELDLRSMIFNCNSTHPHPIVWGGVGWDNNVIGISTWSWCYALWSSLAFPHDLDATLYDLHWHFHMNLMLRSMIFNCNSTWTWCYALWSSIAIPHDLDATFYDLQLAFPHDLDATLYDLQLEFPHDLDATLYDLHWHVHMNLMLRSMIFNCNSTWTWFYALWSSLAFPHDLDATLYDLHWHFHMILMLRSMIFIGISTWSWCYALWSSLAFPHEPDATLYDLQLQFHMILMLRSMIFNWHFPMIWMLRSMIFNWHFHMILMLRSMIFTGMSTWTWCYALWSSIAIPHEPDATLYDLQLQLHMNLILRSMIFRWHFPMIWMLRSMIFIGISTWSWCYALWSSLAFPHELDATLYDLQCEKKLPLPCLRLKWWKGCHSQSRRTFFLIGFECKNWLLAVRT